MGGAGFSHLCTVHELRTVLLRLNRHYTKTSALSLVSDEQEGIFFHSFDKVNSQTVSFQFYLVSVQLSRNKAKTHSPTTATVKQSFRSKSWCWMSAGNDMIKVQLLQLSGGKHWQYKKHNNLLYNLNCNFILLFCHAIIICLYVYTHTSILHFRLQQEKAHLCETFWTFTLFTIVLK